MTCKCGKQLVQRTVAVKTKQIGDHVIVLESETAQVCDECGVIAWGTAPASPWRPLTQPYAPTQPYTPPILPGQPNLARPLPWRPWHGTYISCGSHGSTLAVSTPFNA